MQSQSLVGSQCTLHGGQCHLRHLLQSPRFLAGLHPGSLWILSLFTGMTTPVCSNSPSPDFIEVVEVLFVLFGPCCFPFKIAPPPTPPKLLQRRGLCCEPARLPETQSGRGLALQLSCRYGVWGGLAPAITHPQKRKIEPEPSEQVEASAMTEAKHGNPMSGDSCTLWHRCS